MVDSFRALFISDIHWNNRLPHAQPTEDGRTDRLEDQIRLWQRVSDFAVGRKVQAVFVLGDVFDKSLVDAVTLTAAVEAIASTPAPVFILPGNHDAINTRGGRFTVEAFGQMGNSKVHYLETGSVLKPAPWIAFHPIEYCPADQARERIREAAGRVDVHRIEVLLLHQSIMGCEHNGWICDDGLSPEEVCDSFHWAFSGHFHPPQKFGETGMYLGAPMHHRFDDMGRKAGFWIIEFFEDGRRELEFIDGKAPRMFDFTWPLSRKKLTEARRGDYVRITVEATHAEWRTLQGKVEAYADRLATLGFRVPYPRFKPLYHHAERIQKKDGSTNVLQPDALARAYVKSAFVDKSGLDPKKLLRIGIEALSHGKSAARE